MTTDYTQYNKLRNGGATPDVAEVGKLSISARTWVRCAFCNVWWYHLKLPPTIKGASVKPSSATKDADADSDAADADSDYTDGDDNRAGADVKNYKTIQLCQL